MADKARMFHEQMNIPEKNAAVREVLDTLSKQTGTTISDVPLELNEIDILFILVCFCKTNPYQFGSIDEQLNKILHA